MSPAPLIQTPPLLILVLCRVRHQGCILDVQMGAEPVGRLELMQDLLSWWTAQTAIFYLQHIAQSSAPSARLSSPQGRLYSVICACHCLVLHSHTNSIGNLLSGEHAIHCSQQAGNSNFESPDCGRDDADCTMDQGSEPAPLGKERLQVTRYLQHRAAHIHCNMA